MAVTSSDILRLNYSEKQYLGAQDFRDEQSYEIAMRRRHAIAGHTWGIVDGLVIHQDPTSNVWVIGKGMLIDGYGREVVVFDDIPIDTNEIAARAANEAPPVDVNIWMSYTTVPTMPAASGYAPCSSSTQMTRTRETFRLTYQAPSDNPPLNPYPQVHANWPPPESALTEDPATETWPVLLGSVRWSNNAIQSADTSTQKYAGLVGDAAYPQSGTLNVQGVSIRINGSDEQNPTPTSISSDATGCHIQTKSGAGVSIDKDDLTVKQNVSVGKDLSVAGNATITGKAVIKGTAGNGAGMLTLEASTTGDLAVLTRSASGSGATHDLAIRTAAGAGGNNVLIDRDKVTMKSLTSSDTVLKNGVEIWGGFIALLDGNGADDSDPMRISRHNRATDQNDMRLQIGDNLDGQDRLVVGPVYFGDQQFKENFVVDNLGNVFATGNVTAATVNGRNLATDGAKLDGISANAKNVVVQTGFVFDGRTIPLPSGFTEAQCFWMVSPYSAGTTLMNYIECHAATRTVVARTSPVVGGQISNWANYIIVGVK